MILIKPSFEILRVTDDPLDLTEDAGRTCYKSDTGRNLESNYKFARMIISRGHESVLEHASATVRIICDRGVSHELVRHRIASYSQESTRYCNYKGGVAFVIPPWVDIEPGEYLKTFIPEPSDQDKVWFSAMKTAEYNYLQLLKLGWKPEQARAVLPNSLKTEIVATMNFREWRHFFKLRTGLEAHPQMREIARMILARFQNRIDAIFDDITY